jgi:hypothetical protein
MTTHQEPDILAQLERLNLKTDNNATAIAQLAEIVRYQVMQAERDRQIFQNALAETNQRAEIDPNTFIDSISEIFEEIEQLHERAERDREAAAADRHQAAINLQAWQAEIRLIWEYLYLLQGRNGNAP